MTDATTIRAVLFDMDGVLVDVSGSYRQAIVDTVRLFTGQAVRSGAIQALKNAGGFNNDWKLTAALVAEAGFDVPYERIVEAFDRRYRGEAWDGLIASEPPLMGPDGPGRIRAAIGAIGVVTGRPRAEAEFTLDRFGWRDDLDAFVPLEEQQGFEKPDPYPISLAVERIGAAGLVSDGREVVYVGDSVDDMIAARAAGCRAIGFVPPYLDPISHAALLSSHGADRVIHDHADLLATLYRI